MRPAARWANVAAVRPAVRVANVAAVAGLVAAVAAVLAASVMYIVEPVLVSQQGPDPCIPSNTLPDKYSMTACLSAHPDYYHLDPVAGSYSTPGERFAQELAPAWAAALLLAIAAILSSWLALSERTRLRRVALSALVIGSLVLLVIVGPVLAFLVVGGD